jgi:hypothetical protein
MQRRSRRMRKCTTPGKQARTVLLDADVGAPRPDHISPTERGTEEMNTKMDERQFDSFDWEKTANQLEATSASLNSTEAVDHIDGHADGHFDGHIDGHADGVIQNQIG